MNTVGPVVNTDRGPVNAGHHIRHAWRTLEDALIAFSALHQTCPWCGEYLDEGGGCPDAECTWIPEHGQ